MKVGILGAMLDEVKSIKQLMIIDRETQVGDKVYIEGSINSIDVVLTFSRWGKVAAASTATTLIHKFNVDFMFFTGVAGAVHPMLNIGDIVIGDGYYQHDMDASPIFSKYQIPLTNHILFEPRKTDVSNASIAAEKFIQKIKSSIDNELLKKYSIVKPVVYRGIIASGDKFIANPSLHSDLSYEIGDRKTLAVEMEGAAIAQVCDGNIPYIVIRTISDKADHSAVVDFQSFVTTIACQYSAGILNEYFHELVSGKTVPMK
ncbi:MAG: 5'-methylthioadenosine/adenosylhomocysteine nucleosidase [Legionellaceae bacterium]|nr:5'-methylthioadenosine/adenosylhomocysteine nucleosidase [Legionellaceae bacterium]